MGMFSLMCLLAFIDEYAHIFLGIIVGIALCFIHPIAGILGGIATAYLTTWFRTGG